MHRVLLAFLLVIAVGCGRSRSPEDVVRAWSEATNSSHDAAAAAFFASDAHVIQGGRVFVLRSQRDALRWNLGLPCAGRIVELETRDEAVTARFLLADRPGHRCDGPGAVATAVFHVHRGKIVLWEQTGSSAPVPPV